MAACCTTTSILMQISGAHFAYFPFETFYFSVKRFSNSIKSSLFGLPVVTRRIEKCYY